MIPTTLSGNNTPLASSLNSSGSISGAPNVMASNSREMIIGIASLIIEGRAFAEDEYHMLSLRQSASMPPRAGGAGHTINNSHTANLNELPQTTAITTITPAPITPMSSSSASLLLHGSDLASGPGHGHGLGLGLGLGLGATSSSNFSTAAAGFSGGGRQSPKPSTSKAAGYHSSSNSNNNNMPHLINITTNPHHAFGATTAPLFIETPNAYHSSSSAASSAESTHQRWTQKLCQLRQASGAAHLNAPFEQKVAIEVAQSSSGEPELVSLAIHESNSAAERGASGGGGGDYEIVRRVMLSRSSAAVAVATGGGGGVGLGGCIIGSNINAGSAASSPSSLGGTENFLHSLQSLATTCLRGSSPSSSMDATTPGFHYANPHASTGSSSVTYSKYAPYRATAPNASAASSTTATPRFQSPYMSHLDLQPGSASSSGSGVQSPKLQSIVNSHKRGPKATSTVTSTSGAAALNLPTKKSMPFNSHASSSAASASAVGVAAAASSPASASTLSSLSTATTPSSASSSYSNSRNPYPQQGPHCDQFLKKMGLAKGEAAETEEHYCDMSYVNITCSRWRAYCLKIEAIIERGEQICLEVFLGPANHKILLEQWIISYKEKVPPPTMTLPSLCSAIRSQLYFSQISAWCDLIRKSDKSIYDTGRIVFSGAAGMLGFAGDLATTNLSCTPPNCSNILTAAASSATAASISTSSSTSATASASSQAAAAAASTLSRPRLNVFYRIRTHDATACFNSKPNIHNFPNVNISENCSISICLKSLPRINGGIPKLGAMMSSTTSSTSASSSPATSADNFAAAISAPKYSFDDTPRSSRLQVLKLLSPAIGTTMSAVSAAPTPAPTQASTSTAATSTCYSNCDNQNKQISPDDLMMGGNKVEQLEAGKSANAATVAPKSTRIKCKFYIDETEQISLEDEASLPAHDDDDDDELDVDCDDDSNEPHCSNGSCGSLSHREKQLMKYRKRMFKRDKKHHSNNSPSQQQQCQPMEEGDDDNSTQSSTSPSSLPSVNLVTARQRNRVIEMISTGTQTSASGCCEQCGAEKSLICLKCTPAPANDSGSDEMDACSVGSLSGSETSKVPRSKGDLLLLAIQRTPKAAKHRKQTARSMANAHGNGVAGYLNAANSAPTLNARSSRSQSAHILETESLNNNHLTVANRGGSSKSVVCPPSSTNSFNGLSPSSSSSSLGSGCQVCKRQKTQHNFGAFNGGAVGGGTSTGVAKDNQPDIDSNCSNVANEANAINEADDRVGGKDFGCEINIQVNGANIQTPQTTAKDTTDDITEEIYRSSTMLTPRLLRHINSNSCLCKDASKQQSNQAFSSANKKILKESFVSSTKLTPNFEGFVLSGGLRSNSTSATTPVENQKPKPSQQVQNEPDSSTAMTNARSCTPPMTTATAAAGPLQLNIDCEFKTPTTSQQHHQEQPYKATPKPTLLQVANIYNVACCSNGSGIGSSNSVIAGATAAAAIGNVNGTGAGMHERKMLPKVNLTPIFCNGNNLGCHMQQSAGGIGVGDAASSTQSPESAFPFDIVTINRVKFERAAAAAAAQQCAATNHHNNNNNNRQFNNNNNNSSSYNNNNNTATIFDSNSAAAVAAVPVQKSNSAPTLPNSPSLSPRFAKQAAIYKRRSRHLSDRSDRSSLGSDEQYSDEDLDCGGVGGSSSNVNLLNGMAISPMKQRARFLAKFSRLPLLGNLEESLLQRRITPKTEVLGFKVLLGASGVFCPTQLTIPAAAYFYELHGETLSTPYLCEIGLPRKGYSVPRTGTVQVTLLNPLGTVVRMFVIPYDMHDMPPLHQTFIRQRILAEMSSSNGVVSGELRHNASTQKRTTLDNGNGVANGGDDSSSLMQHSGQYDDDHYDGSTKVGDSCKQKNLGHFISAEHMKRLRYCIHLRFQTSRSGRLMLHTDIRLLISRRTDCDTAAAHAKGLLEAPNELITDTVMPSNPKYSVRQDVNSRI